MADLAARQHGVVARRQLLAAGVTRSMLQERIGRGQLLTLHRGVYAVGHARLRREGHWLAAVLWAGRGAVLSHRDAAALHRLRPANGPVIDVTTPADRRTTPLVHVHSRRSLAGADVTIVDAIPVTSVARTLIDIGAVVSGQHVAKALAEAEQRGRLDVKAISDALHGTRGPGRRALITALADHRSHGAILTRSELEDRFAALLTANGISRPVLNGRVEGMEVDAVWREQRVVVELDGYAYHRSRRSFQRDRTKTNQLTHAGYAVLRFTYDGVVRRGDRIANELQQIISARTEQS